MKIADFLHRNDIISTIAASDRDGVLAEVADLLARNHGADRDELLTVLLEREKLGSTGIGDGIAIPHGKIKKKEGFLLACGRSEQGVEFSSLDGKAVHLFFVVIAPENSVGLHLKMLARISRILKSPTTRKRLLGARDGETMYDIILEQDGDH